MKHPLSNKNYIFQRETETGVRQWHFSRSQAFALMSVTAVVLGAFLFISADFLSNYLYEKRLAEFKSNYSNIANNLELLRAHLEQIDDQIAKIEEKDKAIRTYAGMPEIDHDIRKLGIGGRSLESTIFLGIISTSCNILRLLKTLV